ncbi:MAG TPA: endonuclease domain-containing protein [Acetobacteraceae bacterium]
MDRIVIFSSPALRTFLAWQATADFACVELRLVVEADGGQHADSAYDAWRTACLEAEGWRVVRFWNNEVLRNTEGVKQELLRAMAVCRRLRPHRRTNARRPLPRSGRGVNVTCSILVREPPLAPLPGTARRPHSSGCMPGRQPCAGSRSG